MVSHEGGRWDVGIEDNAIRVERISEDDKRVFEDSLSAEEARELAGLLTKFADKLEESEDSDESEDDSDEKDSDKKDSDQKESDEKDSDEKDSDTSDDSDDSHEKDSDKKDSEKSEASSD